MTGERDREQAWLDLLYARLDLLRERTEGELARVRRSRGAATPQGRSERDAFAALHEARLAQLRAVEDRLCFGRLDLADATRRYVGRIGLSDDRQAQLLLDWRAPAAAAFYRATAAAPGDVVRRRHLACRGRTVVGVEDEALDVGALDERDRATLTGEGALLAALGEHRTGAMRDIVATIQAEQDRVIRSDGRGVLVVQGGPGTGKTAVALHRAAYLLYTERERLSRSGVLLVGPNPRFLRYVEQVLPALGETGMLMATVGELFPGVAATGVEADAVAAVKGRAGMAGVLARAVAARQRVPPAPVRLDVEGTAVVLDPGDVAAARARARAARRPHNAARAGFALDVLGRLARRYAAALGTTLDEGSRPELLDALRGSPDVRREVNLCWLPVSPQRLLADLYADPDRLAAAAPDLSPRDRALLRRERGAAWTPADVPLLDEAAELLGEDDTPARAAAAREAAQRRAEVAYAREVLASSGAAGGLVSAEALAERYASGGPRPDVAERAARDREWAFGHVVVDEAQELSAMAWRLLMRRCPGRSMTVVGDTAQTGTRAGAASWAGVLDPHVAGRWRLEELTVNYRTPGRIMAVAGDLLAAHGVAARAPSSAREGDAAPVAVALPADPAAAAGLLAGEVLAELSVLGPGRCAVITARAAHAGLAAALRRALPAGTLAGPARDGSLDAPVAVLTVAEAKGLEFDSVLVVEPADLLAESPRGVNDLYVAMTRPTRRLRVLHARPLPAGLERLEHGAPARRPGARTA